MSRLPIQDLVESRSKELGLSRCELARRCGFKNINKGIRRIEQVFGGDLGSPCANMILASLSMALDLDNEIIDFAVRETAEILEKEKRRIADEQNAQWRHRFSPKHF